MITEATLARFAREVAKYPADQKQSAVMACLSIVQQEQGYVSAESEAVIADYLGMPQIAVHEVTTFYNMYNQQPVGKYKLNVCTNLPCQLRDGQKALDHLEQKLGVSMGETTADGLFTLQQCECLGACADSPVMLVNDRTMCSFMSNDKLTSWWTVCVQRRASNDHAAANSFAVPGTGVQTCFHDRHINPQIYAGLNGSNWSLKDYEARGGYQHLRKILGKDGGEGLDARSGHCHGQRIWLAWSWRCRLPYGAQVELHAALSSLVRSIWFAIRTRVNLVLAKTATSCNSIRTS
jgi:NADH-quinone oxidoreductase subunit E